MDPSIHAETEPETGEGTSYRISQRIERAALTKTYERKADDPIYRPLQIYALNPAVSRLDGGIAATKIRYEPLQPGPKGSVFEVDNKDAEGRHYKQADNNKLTQYSVGLVLLH